jgi:hypothetical protein
MSQAQGTVAAAIASTSRQVWRVIRCRRYWHRRGFRPIPERGFCGAPRTRSPGLRAAARASALSDPRFSVSNVEPVHRDDAELHPLGRRPAPSPQPMGRTRTSHRLNPRVTSTIGCGRILTVGVRPSTYGGRVRPAVPAHLKRPEVQGLPSMARRLLYPERYCWAGSGGKP